MVAARPGLGYPQGPVSTRARIYMASSLGFSQAGRHFYAAVLLPLVRRLGYEILDPWALTDPARLAATQALPYGPARREAWRTLNREIGASNRAAIDRADGVVAVLDGVASTAARPRRSATRSRGASGSWVTAAIFASAPTTRAVRSICRSSTSSGRAAVPSSSVTRISSARSRRSREALHDRSTRSCGCSARWTRDDFKLSNEDRRQAKRAVLDAWPGP